MENIVLMLLKSEFIRILQQHFLCITVAGITVSSWQQSPGNVFADFVVHMNDCLQSSAELLLTSNDLDFGLDHRAYSRVSLFDLYLHSKFHSHRKHLLWTDGRIDIEIGFIGSTLTQLKKQLCKNNWWWGKCLLGCL